ncbi:hypothetical protein FO519_002227 [Halicephalobus sp. NKZ332]|nr:hypothetical protein FO519_002227 [Halicephalobus sp. NKZ332]
MVLPALEHHLTKIGHKNRWRFIHIGLCFSILGCLANFITSSTNHWLYTSEVLQFYVPPNGTATYDDHSIKPIYFKNATLGPWFFCWLDPTTTFHCTNIDFFSTEEPADVTSSIEVSVRKAMVFLLAGLFLDCYGLICILFVCTREKPFTSLCFSAVAHIFAGIANFSCIIVYMSAVSKEVGNKIFPATEMDDPLFYYAYGYSFIMLKVSFLCTEAAAFMSVLVYMSKRDERTYNRYRIHSIMKNIRPENETQLPDKYYDHSRMHCLQKASRSASIDASLRSNTSRQQIYYPGAEPEYIHIKQIVAVSIVVYYKHRGDTLPRVCYNASVEVMFAHLTIKSSWPPVNIRIPLVSICYIEAIHKYDHFDIRGRSFQLHFLGFNDVMYSPNSLEESRDWLRFLVVRQRIPHSILKIPFDWEHDQPRIRRNSDFRRSLKSIKDFLLCHKNALRQE